MALAGLLFADRALGVIAALEIPLLVLYPSAVQDDYAPLLIAAGVLQLCVSVDIGPVREVELATVERFPGRLRADGTVQADPGSVVFVVHLVHRQH